MDDLDTLVRRYDCAVQRRRDSVAIDEAALRLAIAAQLDVAPSHVPEDTKMLAGMRRALEAYLAATS
jgi:hypothetical protein